MKNNRLRSFIRQKAEELPLQTNSYFDEQIFKHKRAFCVLSYVLSCVCLAVGIASFFFMTERWFSYMFLIGGTAGLFAATYLTFERCNADEEYIEKRVVIRLKRISWRDVRLIRIVHGKHIAAIYGEKGLLMDFSLPLKGVDRLSELAKQKNVKVNIA